MNGKRREKLIKQKLCNRIDTIHPGRIRKQEDKKAMFNEVYKEYEGNEIRSIPSDNRSHVNGTLYYHDIGHDKELLYKEKFKKEYKNRTPRMVKAGGGELRTT